MIVSKLIWLGVFVLIGAAGCAGDDKVAEEPVKAEGRDRAGGDDEARSAQVEGSGGHRAEVPASDGGATMEAEGPEVTEQEVTETVDVPVEVEPEVRTAPAPEEALREPRGELWVFVGRAAVRSEPRPNAPLLRLLPYGQRVEVYGKENGWIKIGEGEYVLRRHLNARKKGFFKRENMFVVKAADTEVKKFPSLSAAVVGKLTRGERVIAKERRGDWIKIGEGQYVQNKDLIQRAH